MAFGCPLLWKHKMTMQTDKNVIPQFPNICVFSKNENENTIIQFHMIVL